jgi:hypothetical protein
VHEQGGWAQRREDSEPRGNNKPVAPPPPPLHHQSGGHGAVPTRSQPGASARQVLIAVGTVMSMAVLAGGAYILGKGDNGDGASISSSDVVQDRQTSQPSATSSDPSPSALDSTTPPEATTTATTTTREDPETNAGQPAATQTVDCWNGDVAPSPGRCALPSGLTGLRTVFPDLSESCALRASTVLGKEEVFECSEGLLLVRFSRWTPGYDRYGYYDRSTGIDGQEWWLANEFAGRRWTTYEATKELPWQWSASFRNFPFSVSIEAATRELRDDRVATIAVRPPSEIGLP